MASVLSRYVAVTSLQNDGELGPLEPVPGILEGGATSVGVRGVPGLSGDPGRERCRRDAARVGEVEGVFHRVLKLVMPGQAKSSIRVSASLYIPATVLSPC